MAIEVQGLEIQIGARTLLHPTNFHVAKGDKIGLVGRNGAGKTTLTRVITGDMLPTAGKVRVSGKLGYLPQDTHASDPTQTALDRMMSARDIALLSRALINQFPDHYALYKIKDSYNMDMLAQVVGLAALNDLPYMRENVRKIRATRERLGAELRRRGWRVCESQTNFLFASPPDGRAEKVFEALKAAKIYVRYFPGPVTGEYLRITVGTEAQADALLRNLV